MRGGPDLHFQAEELASSLPPLMVAAERVASTVSQGVHGRRRVGSGETFWQFRRYQPGDPTQLIDWRQSAKSQPVYVRENEWEAAQSVWLWRDNSPSMLYGSSREVPMKSVRANLLVLALASLLARGGERFTILGSGISPGTGRGMLHRLAMMVDDEQTAGANLPAFEPLPRYGRIVLVGDFLSPLDVVKETVDAFATQGLRGHMLQVLDPAEEALPFAGRVHFEGMESEGDVIIGRVESAREEYKVHFTRHRDALESIARRVGWTFAIHHTDHPPESPLLALYLALSVDPTSRGSLARVLGR
ncbi:MAG: DUF58 domain-containing protein [Rhodospirillales bacterium]|nr:DUF58 domain-containing protein [Rhodospirillales bacterium]MDP6804673.1 DUF58 domain-containing protein [Rhodospirillales bacterium]